MTGPYDDGEDPGGDVGDEAGGGGPVSYGRAVVVTVVALVIGLLVIGVAARPPLKVTASIPTTTIAPSTTTTTVPVTTTTVVRASVKVLVENGTGVPGAAGTYTTALQQQGWAMLPAANAPSPASVSNVYYAAGEQGAGSEIASWLSLKPSAVKQLTTSSPVGGISGAQVVVVLGPDLADIAPPPG